MAHPSDAPLDPSVNTPSRRWPTWLGRGIAFAVLVAACLWAYWLGSWRPTPVEERLYIDPKYLDFGEVWENPKFEWVLPIENPGDEDVQIVGFASSCRSLIVQPANGTVPGRGTVSFRLNFDLTSRSGAGGCGSAGQQHESPSAKQRDYALRIVPLFGQALTEQGW